MKDQPIIVIKKKGHPHAGHHGGAWKVAYADFVTAMMCFFLVMWIVGQSNPMKAGVAGYFRDPGVFDRGTGGAAGIMPGAPKGVTAAVPAPTQSDVAVAKDVLEQAAARVREAIEALPDFANIKDQVQIEVTDEGLRIELVDTSKESFFEVGRSELRGQTTELLGVIARELGKLPNRIALEGHTDSRLYSRGADYGNWELSTERANAARRAMERQLTPNQIDGVRGYADTKLHYAVDPLDARNRRISIVVRNP
jgi:chemotaxis protein MotB